MAGNVKEVTSNDFQNEVLNAKEPVLVDFWAAWCGPCKMVAPVLEELGGEYQGKVKICKVNVDDNRQTAETYGIMSIPTMIVFKDGKEINRLVGFMPKGNLAKALDQIL